VKDRINYFFQKDRNPTSDLGWEGNVGVMTGVCVSLTRFKPGSNSEISGRGSPQKGHEMILYVAQKQERSETTGSQEGVSTRRES